MLKVVRAILCLMVLWIAACPARAQDQPAGEKPQIAIATRILPPFVWDDQGQLAGFSVELWNELAKRTGIQFQWQVKKNVMEILNSVASGESQAGIAAISITSEREQKFDFSQPMFDSGLQILVRSEEQSTFSPWRFLNMLSTGAMPYLLGILALLILVPGHIVWFAERRHHGGEFSQSYFPGIFQAMAWALGAAAGQQDGRPRSRLGRLVSVAAIFVSLLFLTFWQAELTSTFTVQQLSSSINSPEDLPGKRVGTIEKSTSEAYLVDLHADPKTYALIEDALAALEKNELDAVVFDAPVLLYYAANKGKGKVQTVGQIFRRENYGIVFPRSTERPRQLSLRKRINEALLKMREDGSYDALYEKWFAAEGR